MKSKIIARDYKEELANVAELKGFSQEAGNLLMSMMYKAEDSYENYAIVKREVPEKDKFMEDIIDTVTRNCAKIEIAAPNTELGKKVKESKCSIVSRKNGNGKEVLTFPSEKNLLYGIARAGIEELGIENMDTKQKAVLTAISIGKCISKSEVLRDFNGWTWYISPKEIESTECNIIYTFLSFLYGHEFIDSINSTNLNTLKMRMQPELWNEIESVSLQFYLSFDKDENEKLLKKLAVYKTELEKMKNQEKYMLDMIETKKNEEIEIASIDRILSNPKLLKDQYTEYNSKLPNEKKIFSVSHYTDLLQKRKKIALKKIEECEKMQDENVFLKARQDLQLKVKAYEIKTDITKLQNEFLKCFKKKIDEAEERKEIRDLLYEIRYLNFIPNCKMKLNDLMEKIIPKAIDARILNPISNNNYLDKKILAGIFNSKAILLEGLYIKISAVNEGLDVEIYDGETLDSKYTVVLPEDSSVEIMRVRKTKIFE